MTKEHRCGRFRLYSGTEVKKLEYRVLDIRKKTEAEYLEAFERLPKYRQEKATKYRRRCDRYGCVFSYDLLLDMLSSVTELSRDALIIETDRRGKPRLANSPIMFSISHTDGFVACAVGEEPVGIDIETPRDISGKVLEKVLSKEERSYVLGKGEIGDKQAEKGSEISAKFLRIWTSKEAYLKCTGEGLSHLEKARVTVDGDSLGLWDSSYSLISESTDEYFLAIVKADCIWYF